jgi:saccharopine dehydrogenase-like NADP-dependent oxidoreductase
VVGAQYLQNFYKQKFIENKKIAIVGTGVSPGLLCVLTRKAMEDLDSCKTIYNLFYEGVDTKKFVPF